MNPQLKAAVLFHKDDTVLLERRNDRGFVESWGLPEYAIDGELRTPALAERLFERVESLQGTDSLMPLCVGRSSEIPSMFTFGIALRVHARSHEQSERRSGVESNWVRLSELPEDLPSSTRSVIAAYRESIGLSEPERPMTRISDGDELTLAGFSRKSLRIEYDHRVAPHPHAETHFGPIEEMDYLKALRDLYLAKDIGAAEVTFHIPDEIQLASCRNENRGYQFVDFVREVGTILGIRVVWENAPRLTAPDWSLVEQSTYVPARGELCLDIGHKMLGAPDKEGALESIDLFMEQYGSRVRHLHLHINDLKCDQHINDPGKVIDFLGLERFNRMTEQATYIFERGL